MARARNRNFERRSRRVGRRARTGIGFAAAVSATALGAGAADAAVFQVTSKADSGPGTLRRAVANANATPAADTITFAPSVTGAITLTSGEIGIDKPLDIQGPGAGTLSVDGNDASRIFDIDGSAGGTGTRIPVTISGLQLTEGNAGSGAGGAVFGQYTDFSLENSVVSSNTATRGGGLYLDSAVVSISHSRVNANEATSGGGGGVYVDGDNDSANPASDKVTITDSALRGNTASYSGGGLYVDNSTGGDVLITQSTFDGNEVTTGNGGGIKFYGHHGRSTIRQSTISGNTSATRGGGIYFDTDYEEPSDLLIENSTISGNSGTDGAGAYIANDDDHIIVPVVFRNSTVADNASSGEGGGIMLGTRPIATLSSTIVADNTSATPAGADLAQEPPATGSFRVGYSLVENSDGAKVTETGPNVLGADPDLGPLTDNGGQTETMLPADNSPAIDKGRANGLRVDQRGLSRTSGGGTDIGSVEVQEEPPPPPPPVDKPPKISDLRVVPKTFRRSDEVTPLHDKQRGAKIKLKLSEAARVTFRIKVKRGKSAPHSFRRDLDQGRNSVDLSGKLGKRALKPGRYRLIARAVDGAGQKSKRARAPFRITR
jgi:hypothetical protein